MPTTGAGVVCTVGPGGSSILTTGYKRDAVRVVPARWLDRRVQQFSGAELRIVEAGPVAMIDDLQWLLPGSLHRSALPNWCKRWQYTTLAPR